MIGYRVGATTLALKWSFDQPRPNGPQLSSRTFVAPFSVSHLAAQSPAAFVVGEPVSRAP